MEFDIDIKFRIYEDNNKYLVELKQLFKKTIKNVDKDVIQLLISKFPLNIKDISGLDLEIGFKINRGVFRVVFEDVFNIFFIKLF